MQDLILLTSTFAIIAVNAVMMIWLSHMERRLAELISVLKDQGVIPMCEPWGPADHQ